MSTIDVKPELTTLTDSDLLLGWDSETDSTRKIKISTIKAHIVPASTSEKILTFSTNGDANGAFYWLGTFETGVVWSNPYPFEIGLTASSFFDSGANADLSSIVNRVDGSGFATANIANSWLRVDFKRRTLKPSYYSLRQRSFNANLLRNWKLQASNDDATWVDLDSRTNQTVTTSQWLSFPVASTTYYRLFRILQTGLSSSNDNILTLGEIELYGSLQGV